MHICRDIPVLKANIQDGRKMMGDTMKNVTATQLRKEMLSFGKSLALRVPVFSMPVSMKLAPEAFSSSVAKAMGDRSKTPYFFATALQRAEGAFFPQEKT